MPVSLRPGLGRRFGSRRPAALSFGSTLAGRPRDGRLGFGLAWGRTSCGSSSRASSAVSRRQPRHRERLHRGHHQAEERARDGAHGMAFGLGSTLARPAGAREDSVNGHRARALLVLLVSAPSPRVGRAWRRESAGRNRAHTPRADLTHSHRAMRSASALGRCACGGRQFIVVVTSRT